MWKTAVVDDVLEVVDDVLEVLISVIVKKAIVPGSKRY